MLWQNLDGTSKAVFSIGTNTKKKSIEATATEIILLNADGTTKACLVVGEPTTDNHVTSKKYVVDSIRAASKLLEDGKVTGNAPIVAGTGTKITYDTKGLVTSSTSATASDIINVPNAELGLVSTNLQDVVNEIYSKSKQALTDSVNTINTTMTTKFTEVNTDITALQTGKQNNITGAATTITTANLTPDRALVSDADGKVGESAVTATELGYISGLKSPIQSQLDVIPKFKYQTGLAITIPDADKSNQGNIDTACITTISAAYPTPSEWDAVVVGIRFEPSDALKDALYYYDGAEWIFSYYVTTGINRAAGEIAGIVESSTDITFTDGKGTVNHATAAGKTDDALTIKLNGGSVEGTSKFTFDGSAVKELDITPTTVGAAPSSHVGASGNAHAVVDSTNAGFMSSDMLSKLNTADTNATKANTNLTAHVGSGGDSHSVVNTTDAGFMSSAMLTKLNTADSTATSAKSAIDAHAGSGGAAHAVASTTANGFMSSDMVTKLNTASVDASDTKTGLTAHIGSGGDSHAAASVDANGFMTKEMVVKLNGVANNANNYSLPTASATVLGGVKGSSAVDKISVETDGTMTINSISANKVTGEMGSGAYLSNSMAVKLNGGTTEDTDLFTFNGAAAKTIDITADKIGAAPSSHVGTGGSAHAAATTTDSGFMTKEMVTKLAGVADNANNYSLPAATTSALGGVKSSTANNNVSVGSDGVMTVNTITASKVSGKVGSAATADQTANSLALKLNGGTTEGTDLFTFDGAAAKTVDVTAEKVGAAPAGHVGTGGAAHADATTTESGFMTKDMVTKLNGIADNANNYSLPIASASTLGGVKSSTEVDTASVSNTGIITLNNISASKITGTLPSSSKVENPIIVKLNGGTTEGTNMFTFDGSAEKSVNITAASIGAAASSHVGDTGTAHGAATASVNGFMTSAMFTKLSGIADNANNYALPVATDAVLGGVKSSTATDKASIGSDGIITINNISAAKVSGKVSTATTADQIANSVIIKLNGGATEGTNMFTFNGSAAKTINITAALVGAAPAGHVGTGGDAHAVASTTANGFMTTDMVTKLNGIAVNANNYVLPSNVCFLEDGAGTVVPDLPV